MAEHVFQNLEGMLPELEDLERTGIFNRTELRTIVKKRTDLEYKLQRRVVEKEDFLKYLQYELNVDSLRRKRAHRLGLKTKYSVAETGIIKRMHYVFQNDLKLWMQYIDFCKKTDGKSAIAKAFGRLVQLHPGNPSVWIMASKHEFEENGNINNARALMQKSLRINQDSKTLWLEYFRLELLHVDKIKKRRDVLSISTENEEFSGGEVPEIFLANKTASIVYNKAIEVFPDDVEFRLSFLPLYRLFKDTEENQDEIYSGLLKDFPDNEKVHDAVAKRPLQDTMSSASTGESKSDEDWKISESQSCDLYEEAVRKFQTGSMYEFYLQTFLELSKRDCENPEQTTARRLRTVLRILHSAEENTCITEEMFLVWSELLLNIGDEQGSLEVLSRAVKIFPTASLYERLLTLSSEQIDDIEAVNKEFEDCLEKLEKSESLPVWKLWINVSSVRNPQGVKAIYEKLLLSSKNIVEFGRLSYLQWIYENEGLKSARKAFKRLCNACPLTLEFIKKKLDIESQQEVPSVKEIRKAHETALTEFGKSSTDCWLDYVKFELKQAATAVDTVNRLYWRAMKTLGGEYVGDFVEKYNLLQAGSTATDSE
eukprot:gene9213-10187_t